MEIVVGLAAAAALNLVVPQQVGQELLVKDMLEVLAYQLLRLLKVVVAALAQSVLLLLGTNLARVELD